MAGLASLDGPEMAAYAGVIKEAAMERRQRKLAGILATSSFASPLLFLNTSN